ncbi:hypothetical protein BH09MYX1_BH09MYX1_25180 [soil metagenome]
MDEVRGSIPLGSTDRMKYSVTPFLTALLAASAIAVGACDHHDAAPADPVMIDAAALVVPSDWPRLPTTADGVAGVVRDRANRPRVAPTRPTIDEIKKHRGDEQVVAGDDAIAAVLDRWIGGSDKPSFVLFGSLHDSAAHVDALRRLTTRMPQLWGVVMEQFVARGAWIDADVASADIDDADLADFFATGDGGALYRLGEAQIEHDYAAWKFGYVGTVLDAVVALRGAGKPVFACAIPKSLVDSSLEGTAEETTLREAHCAMAAHEKLRLLGPSHVKKGDIYFDDIPPPMRAAFFLGDDHAGVDGIARFLHENSRVASVHMIGGRPDPELPPEMTVVDPVLVPLQSGPTTSFALLLPNTTPAAIERVIDRTPARTKPAADGTITAPTVWVDSDGPARIALAGADVVVGSAGEWLRVRPGVHACTITRQTKDGVSSTVTFALRVTAAADGFTQIHIDSVGVRVSDSP